MVPFVRIRTLETADRAAVLRLNNAVVPNVNELDEVALDELLRRSALALVTETGGTVDGLVVVLEAGTDYASDNYRWFDTRYTGFCYVDRIVVAADRRGAGNGAALHDAVYEHAQRTGTRMIALEVNLEPPNPRSLRFHERMGFAEVGTYRGGSGKLVSMRTRDVPEAAPTG